MKKIITIAIVLLNSFFLFSQTVGKVNSVEDPAKIGSVATGSISSLSGAAVVTIYKNCKEILENNPGSPDGVYVIDPDGAGAIEPFNCYCDMTTDGGGWTIVGNYKSPALYEEYMLARSDASYGTDVGNPNSTSPWTDWRILAGVTWPAEFVIILDRPTFSSGWEAVNAKVIHRVKNRDIMPNNGTPVNLSTDDNLYFKFSFVSGWTDVGSSSYSSDYYWYPYTSSSHHLILFTGNGDYLAYYGNGVPGGNNSWHHSARMLIR